MTTTATTVCVWSVCVHSACLCVAQRGDMGEFDQRLAARSAAGPDDDLMMTSKSATTTRLSTGPNVVTALSHLTD